MEKRILKELESKDGETRVFIFSLIIISAIIIFFGTVFIIGGSKINNSIKNEEMLLNKSEVVNNKKYKILSNNAKIEGMAEMDMIKKDGSINVSYFIHITENLPANKKCFENDEDTDDNCRYIDFYNYVVSINDGDNDRGIIGRLYPIFCSSFANLSESKTLYDSYTSCWQGEKKNKYQHTDKYFIKIDTSYDTLDDFLASSVIDIYDAKDYTERTNITKNKMTTNTEVIHVENAVKNGNVIKKYKFKIVEL